MSQENVEIVRFGLEAFARGDLEKAMAMTHPDIVCSRVDPDLAVYHGRDGFLEMVDEWLEGFEDWSYEAIDYFDFEDQVILEMHQSARGVGSGVPVEGTFWVVYTLADGQITRFAIHSDRAEAFAAVDEARADAGGG